MENVQRGKGLPGNQKKPNDSEEETVTALSTKKGINIVAQNW